MNDDWRDIPCGLIDWHCLPAINRRTAILVERQCSKATDWQQKNDPEAAENRWHEMPLGELADRGEKWWRRRGQNFGKSCVDAVKSMIDHAAAGYEVRRNCHNQDAYVPREIPPPPPEKRRRVRVEEIEE